MEEYNNAPRLIVPVGVTLAVLFTIMTAGAVTCTAVNVKLLKDKVRLKQQLLAVRQTQGPNMVVPREANTVLYEEVDLNQASTTTEIDISKNKAYSRAIDL